MEKVADIGWANPGALRVSTSLLYWPDCAGARMLIVSTVVPGERFPMATLLDVVEREVDGPPFTDSAQLRIANFRKSPDETRVALP